MLEEVTPQAEVKEARPDTYMAGWGGAFLIWVFGEGCCLSRRCSAGSAAPAPAPHAVSLWGDPSAPAAVNPAGHTPQRHSGLPV